LIRDRRWSTRKHLALSVELEVPQQAAPIVADLRDLSLGGLFVETRFLLPLHPLIVTFKLPARDTIRLGARVVHRTPAGAGLMFMQTSTQVIRALSETLSQLSAITPVDQNSA
jgi:hypothetical protein